MFTGGGEADVGAETAAHRAGERGCCCACADTGRRHAEQLFAHRAGARHHATAKYHTVAIQGRQTRTGNTTTGHFGDREGEPAFAQQVQHHRFHGLFVDAEYIVTEHVAHARFLFGDEGRNTSAIGGLGGDAHLDALDAAGEKRQGRVACCFEGFDVGCQQFGQARFTMAPGAQRAAGDHRRESSATFDVRQDGAIHHDVHFIGHTRHGVQHLLAYRADETRRGARLIGDGAGTDRHIGLTQVVVGHHPPA